MSEELPSFIDEEDWQDFQAHRKEIGKPMTETAKRRMLRKLYRMAESGEDIAEALDQSIRNGWQDVWPVKQQQVKPKAHQDYKPEPLPETSEEQAKENLKKLQTEAAKVFNISGGRK